MLRETLVNSLEATSYLAEIIVVDNGSNIESRKSLASLVSEFDQNRLILATRDWSSLGRARNLGLSLSNGELIVFLDSDDLLEPAGLEESCRSMRAKKHLDVRLGGWCRFQSKEELDSGKYLAGKQITFEPSKEKLEWFYVGWDSRFNVPIHSAIFRKKSLQTLFREDLSTREDFDFWLRLVHSGSNFEVSKSLVAYYRRHQHQMTRKTDGLLQAQKSIRALAKSLGLKRKYLIVRFALDFLVYFGLKVNKNTLTHRMLRLLKSDH